MEAEAGSDKVSSAEVVRRLERHPVMKARITRLLDLIENAGGDLKLADEAEQRAIDELRAMGQELLHEWGQRLANEEAQGLVRQGDVVHQVKKTALAQHFR